MTSPVWRRSASGVGVCETGRAAVRGAAVKCTYTQRLRVPRAALALPHTQVLPERAGGNVALLDRSSKAMVRYVQQPLGVRLTLTTCCEA